MKSEFLKTELVSFNTLLFPYRLTEEFLAIFEKCPSRLKKKIMSQAQDVSSAAIFKLLFTQLFIWDALYSSKTFVGLYIVVVAVAAVLVLLEAELVNRQLTLNLDI